MRRSGKLVALVVAFILGIVVARTAGRGGPVALAAAPTASAVQLVGERPLSRGLSALRRGRAERLLHPGQRVLEIADRRLWVWAYEGTSLRISQITDWVSPDDAQNAWVP
jgi:hypothetical protein